MAGCAHLGAAPAVDHGDALRPQLVRLHRRVHGRHAAANHHDAPTYRHLRQVFGLAQLRNKVHRIAQSAGLRLGNAYAVDPRQAQAQEYGVKFGGQPIEVHVAPQSGAVAHGNAANREQPLHLFLGEVVHGFVAGQAIFVQSAEFGLGVHQHHVVPVARQAVRAGQAGWPGADHGHAFARGRGAGEQGLAGVGHQVVGGIALQEANLHWLVLLGVAHAGLLAQHFGGADAGAHAA